jgi:8-oxo-dGTP pyrophosphatase MutT (NUDIX family)
MSEPATSVLNDESPRPASSLILVRDIGLGPEAFLMVRDRGMSFASSAWVFPGGKVDAQDHDGSWAEFCDDHADHADFRAAKIAAIRETFEEAGVLYARRNGVLIDAADILALGTYEADRPFFDLISHANLRLACDLLAPFARWIGPRIAPKRFDTAFFLALVPASQNAGQTSRETVHAEWLRPSEILQSTPLGTNERYLMFPTRSNLERLAQFSSLAEIMAHVETVRIEPVMPELITVNNEPHLRIRDDQGYPQTVVRAADVPRG